MCVCDECECSTASGSRGTVCCRPCLFPPHPSALLPCPHLACPPPLGPRRARRIQLAPAGCCHPPAPPIPTSIPKAAASDAMMEACVGVGSGKRECRSGQWPRTRADADGVECKRSVCRQRRRGAKVPTTSREPGEGGYARQSRVVRVVSARVLVGARFPSPPSPPARAETGREEASPHTWRVRGMRACTEAPAPLARVCVRVCRAHALHHVVIAAEVRPSSRCTASSRIVASPLASTCFVFSLSYSLSLAHHHIRLSLYPSISVLVCYVLID